MVFSISWWASSTENPAMARKGKDLVSLLCLMAWTVWEKTDRASTTSLSVLILHLRRVYDPVVEQDAVYALISALQ